MIRSKMSEKFKEECAVMGVYGHRAAANIVYLGLYALQHRGQESSGIVSSDFERHHCEIGMGLVSEIFKSSSIDRLRGTIAIGHNRYSTHGSSELRNASPLTVDLADGPLSISHNGNLINAASIRAQLESTGSIFRSTVDSEVIAHLIARSTGKRTIEKIIDALSRLSGAYSILFMTRSELIAHRDPSGFRPLSIGQLGSAYVFASESCAFDLIGARFLRDLEPGEMIVVDADGLDSSYPFRKAPHSYCVFEHIYFARPDSTVFGESVYQKRKELGAILAREAPADVDMVISVPDSGNVAALGYAAELGAPFEMGIIRNHYVGRTFIEPVGSIRNFGIKVKLNPVRSLLAGKRIALIDDSIVRGSTARKLIKMIREAGAKEIHFRISSPPSAYSCFYGIDTPNRSELIAATHSIEQIKNYLDVDSLAYLSLESLRGSLGAAGGAFCDACFSGKYPIGAPESEGQLDLLESAHEMESAPRRLSG